ncbi:MAG: 50S ribosomal protein L10 [Nitrospinota bacterium]
MPTRQKVEKVEALRERFLRARAAVLMNYRGLSVAELTRLRGRLREAQVEFRVVKNSLTRRALLGTPFQPLEEHFQGPVSVAWGYDDPVAPAREMVRFTKENPQAALTVGFLEGRVMGPEELATVAELPSREALLAQLLGTLQGPVAGLPRLLRGVLSRLLYVLDALRRGREGGG